MRYAPGELAGLAEPGEVGVRVLSADPGDRHLAPVLLRPLLAPRVTELLSERSAVEELARLEADLPVARAPLDELQAAAHAARRDARGSRRALRPRQRVEEAQPLGVGDLVALDEVRARPHLVLRSRLEEAAAH